MLIKKESKKYIYIARDRDGGLFVFNNKPFYDPSDGYWYVDDSPFPSALGCSELKDDIQYPIGVKIERGKCKKFKLVEEDDE